MLDSKSIKKIESLLKDYTGPLKSLIEKALDNWKTEDLNPVDHSFGVIPDDNGEYKAPFKCACLIGASIYQQKSFNLMSDLVQANFEINKNDFDLIADFFDYPDLLDHPDLLDKAYIELKEKFKIVAEIKKILVLDSNWQGH